MRDPRRWDGPWLAVCAAIVAAVYIHDALPYLTTLPRVNVDEPWLLERAYQVLKTGTPRQPMYGLDHAYLLQTGYGYLFAPWIRVFGLGMFQARLLTVLLGGGTLISVGLIASRLVGRGGGVAAALFLATDSNFLGGARNACYSCAAGRDAAGGGFCRAASQQARRFCVTPTATGSESSSSCGTSSTMGAGR